MSNIAISELQTRLESLENEDLILVSKKDGDAFTSAKITGEKLKNSVKTSITSTDLPSASSTEKGAVIVDNSLSIESSNPVQNNIISKNINSINETLAQLRDSYTILYQKVYQSTIGVECEYLQSNSNTYIEVGDFIDSNNITKLELDLYMDLPPLVTETENAEHKIFGNASQLYSKYSYIDQVDGRYLNLYVNNIHSVQLYAYCNIEGGLIKENRKFKLKLQIESKTTIEDNYSVYYSDFETEEYLAGSFTLNKSYRKLFTGRSNGKFYGLKCYNSDNTLLFDFKPWRVEQLCKLYDVASNTSLYFKGSGSVNYKDKEST